MNFGFETKQKKRSYDFCCCLFHSIDNMRPKEQNPNKSKIYLELVEKYEQKRDKKQIQWTMLFVVSFFGAETV